MLVQVVDNAWKYSQPGAPIRISGTLSGSEHYSDGLERRQ